MFLGHDRRIDDLTRASNKLDVATILAGLDKAGCFEATLDFREKAAG
jgi:hypothetical protein